MNYIETTNGKVTFTHYLPFDPVYGLGKTEAELKKTGYLVESVPEYAGEVPEGKAPELRYDGTAFSWVMADKPKREDTQAEKIAALEAQQAATNEAVLGLMDMLAAASTN